MPASAEDIGDMGLVLGSGRSCGRGTGNPLQYSCLESSMDREAWRATVHGVAKSQKWLRHTEYINTHTQKWMHVYIYTPKCTCVSISVYICLCISALPNLDVIILNII